MSQGTDIDAKIVELEKEAEELQPQVQRLNERLTLVSNQLDVLRKARGILVPEADGGSNSSGSISNGSTSTRPSLFSQANGSINSKRSRPDSVGSIAVEVLRQEGRVMHVRELLPLVRAKGKPDLAESTLVSTLCGYVESGKLKRPYPSMYGLV